MHRGCGAITDVASVCASCREPVKAGDFKVVPGPGRDAAVLATTHASRA
jgi:hypothetical protein